MSEELNKQLENLTVKETQQSQPKQVSEEAKVNTESQEQQQQTQQEVKKKKVIKSVRFNLESKRAANAERIAKEISDIQPPQSESKGLFPATLPEQNPGVEVIGEQPSLDSGYTEEELAEMENIKTWLFANLKNDVDNAKAKGANVVELKVRNFVLLRKEDNQLWNRVEFDTTFDFTTIEQILLSPEIPHPQQPTLKYTTVVLFGKNKNIPLVFPYCFQKEDIVEELEQGLADSKNKKEKKKLKKKLKKKMGNYTPNELDNWILVNSSLKEACHKINEFQDI